MTVLNKAFFRFLDTVGDGSGSKEANVNGSVTPVEFKITAPSGKKLHISRMIIFIQDTTAGFSANTYGSIAALTNGVTLAHYLSNDAVKYDLLDGTTVKSNMEWTRYMHDVVPQDYGAGDKGVSCRWTFQKSGEPLTLETGEYLQATINDDLTGLIEHRFEVQGTEEFK